MAGPGPGLCDSSAQRENWHSDRPGEERAGLQGGRMIGIISVTLGRQGTFAEHGAVTWVSDVTVKGLGIVVTESRCDMRNGLWEWSVGQDHQEPVKPAVRGHLDGAAGISVLAALTVLSWP